MASEFANRLAKMQENGSWQNAKKLAHGVPSSLYNMQLQGLELKESQNGNLMIAREHVILDGEFQGEVVRDNMNLSNEIGQRFVAQFIEQMGYQVPDDLTQIEDVLTAILNDAPSYTGQVKHSEEGFTNVQIRKLLSAEETPERVVEVPTKPEPAPAVKAPTSKAPTAAPAKPVVAAPAAKPAAKPVQAKKSEPPAPTIVAGGYVSFNADAGDGSTVAIVGKVNSIDGTTVHVENPEDTATEYEVPMEECTPAEAPAVSAEMNPLYDSLQAFCQAQEIATDESDTLESLIVKVKSYKWPADQLTADEVEMLKTIEADFVEAAPVAKPKVVAKAVAKK